jgi:hypothetical protein
LLDGNSGGNGPPLVLAAAIHAPAIAIAKRVSTSVGRRVWGTGCDAAQSPRQNVHTAKWRPGVPN